LTAPGARGKWTAPAVYHHCATAATVSGVYTTPLPGAWHRTDRRL